MGSITKLAATVWNLLSLRRFVHSLSFLCSVFLYIYILVDVVKNAVNFGAVAVDE
ncbi:hypothetical protein COLO4_05661 [Corchorus olitorius]|uniref:Uncharacterized protein n=1 Tax=Corchorus olitorius TaxID=93759 RepID=A0A1R3KQ97_9ROSI|nr:hypothetical protein COLO4_05661 [Corchorus olitorius]